MGFQKSEGGSETAFVVTPETIQPVTIGPLTYIGRKLRSPLWLIALVLALPISGPLLLYLTVMNTALYWTGKKIRQAHSASPHRVPSSFSVSRDAIRKNGSTIRVRDAHRLVIRNHITEARGGAVTLIVTDDSRPGRNVGMAMGKKFLDHVQTISYRVDVEAGGQATLLGGGLTSAGAFGLAQDVSKITGLAFYH